MNIGPNISLLRDSTGIFNYVSKFEIPFDTIENQKLSLVYTSVSETEFNDAISRNWHRVHFFDKNFKINELSGFRSGDSLVLESKAGKKYFVDKIETDFARSKRYYLQDSILNYFILKEMKFEDYSTLLVSKDSTNNAIIKEGFDLIVNERDSLLFYTDNFRTSPLDSSTLFISKIYMGKITQLIEHKINWMSEFHFFDKGRNRIYFVYSVYDGDYRIKSTFAKIDYRIKK